MRTISLLAGAALLYACAAQAAGPSTDAARDYLGNAMRILREGHVNRDRLD